MTKKSQINVSDLIGLTALVKNAGINITDLVEDVNKRIVHPPLLLSTPIQTLITGISSIAFNNVRRGMRLVGGGLEQGLGQLNPKIGFKISFEKKENLMAVLNGVIGDYLVDNENPLRIPMQFRNDGERIDYEDVESPDSLRAVNGKILLMIHGSCMNDLRWTREGHDHGSRLGEELEMTPVYLNYNSGLHISTNGRELDQLLGELISSWPVPVEEISIIAHSMGGLVTRSAIHYGNSTTSKWVKLVKKIVFLGTPHHGAPLERIGNFVDVILETIPYARPFARLGKMRSAGITDLRYGNLVDEDWTGKDRFKLKGDKRMFIPLPKGIECYAIAATLGKEDEVLKGKLLGDGLVQLGSALGEHKKSRKKLKFKKTNSFIIYESNHLDLLSCQVVFNKMKSWL